MCPTRKPARKGRLWSEDRRWQQNNRSTTLDLEIANLLFPRGPTMRPRAGRQPDTMREYRRLVCRKTERKRRKRWLTRSIGRGILFLSDGSAAGKEKAPVQEKIRSTAPYCKRGQGQRSKLAGAGRIHPSPYRALCRPILSKRTPRLPVLTPSHSSNLLPKEKPGRRPMDGAFSGT